MDKQADSSQTMAATDEVHEGVRSLQDYGFYVVERSLSEEKAAQTAQVLDELIARGKAAQLEGFGYHLSPACNFDARLGDVYAEPRVLAVAEALFQDEARLTSSGARVSDRSDMPRLTWHTHPFSPEEEPTEENPLRAGTPISHLVYGWYMEGCSPESGPLIVLPRRYDDVVNRAIGGANEAWPNEVAVNCAPGSCVLFTTDLWHSALAGSSERRRHLLGGHLQAAGDTRVHKEDVVHEGAAIEEAASENRAFARLIGR